MHRPIPTAWLVGSLAAVSALTVADTGALAGPPLLEPSGWVAWSDGRDGIDGALALLRLGLAGFAWYLVVVSLLLCGARTAGIARSVAPDWLVRAALTSAVVGVVARPAGAAAECRPVEIVEVMRRLPIPPAPAVAPPQVVAPAEWAVRPGDHFWSIAARTLEDAHDRPPTLGEVDRYWRTLVQANRDRLAVADEPDLLFPGQLLRLPAV